MSRRTLLATSAGTLACALGIGVFMQAGGSAPAQKAAPVPQVAAAVAPGVAAADAEPSALVLGDIALTAAERSRAAPPPLPEAVVLIGLDDAISPPLDPSVPRIGCDLSFGATTLPGAMVRLSLEAPCHAGERVTLHHTGMMVSHHLSGDGRLDLEVPALSRTAFFIAELGGGVSAVAMTPVPELDTVERVALQWRGESGFQIHAREFGAAYGTDGHVWSGATGTAGHAGRVLRLGDGAGDHPLVAEIYSFPGGTQEQSGIVSLTVEAEVTEANCGRDIAAQSIQLSGGARPRTQDLVLSVPDCTAVGDFLVLDNLVEDLRIAAR